MRFVFASDPPALSSPANSSTITSTTLNWQAPSYTLYSSNPYRIQVDDDSAFGSINKDYYTSNTHYSPSLTTGTWFWKVKAKDGGGTWSNWSEIWSFVLSDSATTPSPTPSPTPTPTPTPATTTSSNTFIISNTPAQVNSDQSFTTSINLSLSDKPNTLFYIKGAFKKTDGSNYFGLTKVNGNWIKNGSNYSNQYSLTTDQSGNWSGNLEALVDSDDSGYSGSGDYIFKVARYDTNGNLTWSNEITIHINNVAISQETTSNTNQSTTTKTTTISIPTASPSLTIPSSIIKITSSKIASVAGVSKMATPSSTSSYTSSSSANIKINSQKLFNPFLIIGTLFVIIGGSLVGFIIYKQR